tara:strand:+ start:925 stop:1527 length:603 start_codon:yes stop_codon:yes gene_type:complete
MSKTSHKNKHYAAKVTSAIKKPVRPIKKPVRPIKKSERSIKKPVRQVIYNTNKIALPLGTREEIYQNTYTVPQYKCQKCNENCYNVFNYGINFKTSYHNPTQNITDYMYVCIECNNPYIKMPCHLKIQLYNYQHTDYTLDTCNLCKFNCISPWHFEVDHIYPRSKNGSNNHNNLQILCKSCNISKKNKLMGEISMIQYSN